MQVVIGLFAVIGMAYVAGVLLMTLRMLVCWCFRPLTRGMKPMDDACPFKWEPPVVDDGKVYDIRSYIKEDR